MKNYAKRNACILNRHRYNNRRNVMIQCSRSICCPDCKNLKAKWWIKLNYTEAVEYILNVPKFTTKNKPEHTVELLKRLGHPECGMKVIHVAGTNGKRFCLCLSFRDADTGQAKRPPFLPLRIWFGSTNVSRSTMYRSATSFFWNLIRKYRQPLTAW